MKKEDKEYMCSYSDLLYLAPQELCTMNKHCDILNVNEFVGTIHLLSKRIVVRYLSSYTCNSLSSFSHEILPSLISVSLQIARSLMRAPQHKGTLSV